MPVGGQNGPGQVGRHGPDALLVHLRGDNPAGVGGQFVERRDPPAAAGLVGAGRPQRAGRLQSPDGLGDRRLRDPGRRGELRARGPVLDEDVVEHRAVGHGPQHRQARERPVGVGHRTSCGGDRTGVTVAGPF